jgi:hypothetical protein
MVIWDYIPKFRANYALGFVVLKLSLPMISLSASADLLAAIRTGLILRRPTLANRGSSPGPAKREPVESHYPSLSRGNLPREAYNLLRRIIDYAIVFFRCYA